MRIDLLFPRLPPALDGIGDYTALQIYHLAKYDAAALFTSLQPEDIAAVFKKLEQSGRQVAQNGLKLGKY